MVLIMDVARFKYPPHWIPLPLLHQSMQVVDPETGKSRGYMLLSPTKKLYEKCGCTHTCGDEVTSPTDSSSDDNCVNGTDPAPKDVLQSILSHACALCAGDGGATVASSCCGAVDKL